MLGLGMSPVELCHAFQTLQCFNASLQQRYHGMFFSTLLFTFSAIKRPLKELRLSFKLGEKYVNKIFLPLSGSDSTELSLN